MVPARMRGSSRFRLRVAWSLGLAGLVAVLLALAGYRWSLAELVRVEHELQAGRPGPARARLARLKGLGLGGVEAEYWRGACAEAQGQVDAALAIWAGIPAGSSRFPNATIRRARL